MDALEARITELEIRYTHQEALLQTLSDLIREQQTIIDALARQLRALEGRFEDEAPPHERPPHY